jgi:FlaG/FlaF family flagellin (archaellin)
VEDKLSAYRCEACTHVARREIDPAKAAIRGMLELDATARFSPDTQYPPPVLELYHAVRESLFSGTMDIRTVAIGDFEDNSVYTGTFKDYDFSLFHKALIHTISADLAAATDLKLVDRQRIDALEDEIRLGQSDFADPEQAVRAGQLLGAHTFVFGQYMILSKDTVRIDARVVQTATGEVLMTKQVTGEFSGKPEKFLELEQQLVTAIAQGIDEILTAANVDSDAEDSTGDYFAKKRATIKGRPDYVESKFLVAMALEREDAGDYEEAQTAWKKVLEADPANEVAPVRIQVLATLMNG